MYFHVLNRAVARLPVFEKLEDFEAFDWVLIEAVTREPLPILAYGVMPNHRHLGVRTQTDQQLTDFFRWLTHTHLMRWQPKISRASSIAHMAFDYFASAGR